MRFHNRRLVHLGLRYGRLGKYHMTGMRYAIDLDQNIIRCEYRGHLEAMKLIEHIVTIRNDPEFHNGLNTISDIRKAVFSRGFLEMNTIAGFVKKTSQTRSNFKLALIVNQSTADSAELYRNLSPDDHVKLCFDMEEAEAWVGG